MDSTERPHDSNEEFDAVVQDLRAWARRVERRRVLRFRRPRWPTVVLVVFIQTALVFGAAAWRVWSTTPPP